MKIENPELLAFFRCKKRCEYCQYPTPDGADPHHLFSRGAGHLDIRINLISLCRQCHSRNHDGNHPDFDDLIRIISRREGVASWRIVSEVYRLRRMKQKYSGYTGRILGGPADGQAVPDDPLAGQ